jgi:hypothetical protein
MSTTRTETHSNERVEFISIQDSKFPTPHFLMLTTKEIGTALHVQSGRTVQGSIETRAVYFFGPLTGQAGQLVSVMAGEANWEGTLRVTNGAVDIRLPELRGIRLGGYLFNRIITWAKTFEPERRVVALKLSAAHAIDPANKTRRNLLYRKFGLRLIFVDGGLESEGHSDSQTLVSELKSFPLSEWPKISSDSWHNGFLQHSNANYKSQQLLRQYRREMKLYRHKFNSFEVKISALRQCFAGFLNWPLILMALVLGACVGAGAVNIWEQLDALWKWLVK